MPEEGSPFDVPPAAFGRYRVLHHIGAGSLGPVFRGEDPDSGHAVVITLLRVKLSAARARQTADALAALSVRLPAQGVVAGIVDAGLVGDDAYYVTPLVPGDSLDAALQEYGPAAMADALPRLRALAYALDAAAAFGIWHGALHPRDIIVSADDTTLVGLGVAPLLEKAGVQLPVRTPYTAPEILEGQKSSPLSDQFALAAIAYEWLFGRRIAGPADTVVGVPALAGIHQEKVAAAFTSALAVHPPDRFASSGEFVAAVSAAAHETEHETDDETEDETEKGHGSPFRVALDEKGEDKRESALLLTAQELSFDVPADEPPNEDLRLSDEPEEVAPPPFWQGAIGIEPASPAEEDSRRFGAGALVLTLCAGLAVGLAAGYWLGISGVGARTARVADPAGREYTDAPVAVSSTPPTSNVPVSPSAAIARREPFDSGVDGVAQGKQGRQVRPIAPSAAPVTPRVAPAASGSARAGSGASSGETSAKPPTGGEGGRASLAPGRILVRTTPAGARVTVDGVVRGDTPVAVRDLDLGTHTVVIAGEGRPVIERRVTLTADRPSRSIEERLAAPKAVSSSPAVSASPPASAETGVLEIDSRPVGARVTVNDRPMGATPLTLPAVSPGTYTVRIERAGYRPWSTTVQITSGQRARVAASLVGGQSQE